MTIKTTRIKSTQAPVMETLDLSNQLNGSRQTFSLPRKIHNFDRNYLVWNSTVYRNDVNHRYYSISADGMSITTYFDTAPAGGPGHTLQLAVDMSGDGADQTASKADVEEAVTKLEDADAGIREDLESEATTRQERDGELQSQIDAVVNSSDVKDVVGTKAELNAYDKSTLGDNDIIKVLKDESEDDATTYYRYVKAENDFKVIGEIGPYYTKAEADDKFISGDGNSNYVFLEKPWTDTIVDSDSVKNGLPTPWWTNSAYSIFMANQPQRLENVRLGTSIVMYSGGKFQDIWGSNGVPSDEQHILGSVIIASSNQMFPQAGSLSHTIAIGANVLDRLEGGYWSHSVILVADEDPMLGGEQEYNVCIGGQTSGRYNTAVGHRSQASNGYDWNGSQNDLGSIAIGYDAHVSGQNVSIGSYTYNTTYRNTVALGANSRPARDDEVAFGNNDNTPLTRYLAGVRAGEKDTDAVNLKQVREMIEEAGGGGSDVRILDARVTTPESNDVYSANYVNKRLDATSVAIGKNASAGTYDTAYGSSAKASSNAVALGYDTRASAPYGVAVGYGGTEASHESSVALGYMSHTYRKNEVSIGSGKNYGQSEHVTRYLARVSPV